MRQGNNMDNSSIRLDGKKILITGVSRPLGIGATLAKRFAEAGAIVAVHGYSDYDVEVGHKSAMRGGTEILAKQLCDQGLSVTALTPGDLIIPGIAEKAVEEAAAKLGGLDGLVLNHAYSTYGEIGSWTPEHIDPHLLVNVRASMMMIQSFVSHVDAEKGDAVAGAAARDNIVAGSFARGSAAEGNTTNDRAITLFTSGQYQSTMVSEIAYCVSKDAIIGLCHQASRLLGPKNIRVNCINPGPNDTGYCFGEAYEAVAKSFPSGRWGTPDDTADLLLFLHSSYAKWITGQVIASDGGVIES